MMTPSGAVDAVTQTLQSSASQATDERSATEPASTVAVEGATSTQILAGCPNEIDAGDRIVHILLALNAPRIVLFGDLLAPDECEALITMSRRKLERSTIVDPSTGRYEKHADRTSEGTYFRRTENELVARIERRIGELTDYPVELGEPLQVMRYGPGAEYKPHFDYFDPSEPSSRQMMEMGGQRMATVLIYLNDVQAGGSTVFPQIGLDVLPRRGNAVFFAYSDEEGGLDTRTLHGGSPVGMGEKWIATKWLRHRNRLRESCDTDPSNHTEPEVDAGLVIITDPEISAPTDPR
jgi:prolyl 4-hydroxylase